ncbi:hypothetical protein PHMEG_00023240 [Phytophthora megakarya]|uniref:Uncharacterized protein n=1 Tax=Phytophthora megakarya TaxID=4795 RepID=A0A225VJ74_9STRA|nr:hypothetical protein PHMEG_00023240 [Phytophthora megakarya]
MFQTRLKNYGTHFIQFSRNRERTSRCLTCRHDVYLYGRNSDTKNVDKRLLSILPGVNKHTDNSRPYIQLFSPWRSYICTMTGIEQKTELSEERLVTGHGQQGFSVQGRNG